jgi:hypothetical protein
MVDMPLPEIAEFPPLVPRLGPDGLVPPDPIVTVYVVPVLIDTLEFKYPPAPPPPPYGPPLPPPPTSKYSTVAVDVGVAGGETSVNEPLVVNVCIV